jgi:hypothetical protein
MQEAGGTKTQMLSFCTAVLNMRLALAVWLIPHLALWVSDKAGKEMRFSTSEIVIAISIHCSALFWGVAGANTSIGAVPNFATTTVTALHIPSWP